MYGACASAKVVGWRGKSARISTQSVAEADRHTESEFPYMSTLPPEFFRFLERADTVLARVESLLPPPPRPVNWDAHAYRWRRQRGYGQLEAVLHPMIGAEAEAQAARAGGRPVLFDVPLLTESSRWRARVDRILVVDCPEVLQVRRVMQRSGWEAAAVERVVAQQAPRARRRAIADAVIHNGDAMTLDGLQAAVRTLWAHWMRVEQ